MRSSIGKAFKFILCVALSAAMLTDTAYATTVSDIRREKKETEKQLDKANSKIDDITRKQDELQEQIEELDSQLVEVLAAISMIEDEIEENEKFIEEARVEYEQAKADCDAQYEAMKVRIKYMYEKGDTGYLEFISESRNFSEMINKTEYVEKIYEYDRNMLVRYQQAKQDVADRKAALEEKEEELAISKYELDEEKKGLDELMANKKEIAEDFDNQLAKAKQEAAAFKAKIKQQNLEIKKKEKEEADRKAAEAKLKEKNEEVAPVKETDTNVIIETATGSGTGKDIANYACKFVGNPYVAGGTSLTDGCDCSGFTYAVYKAFGYTIPRTSTSQRGVGTSVSQANAQPGDIVCYAGHVAIYLGGGKIVHASTPATGIKYGEVNYKPIIDIRRVVN